MLLTKTTAIYFSPTNSTQKLLRTLLKDFSQSSELDLTPFEWPELPELSAAELAIVAFPVYGGRIPPLFAARLKALRGHDTPLVLIATYGNRAYDDALLEAKTLLEAQGFKTIAAAAFICQHSVVPQIAAGRPNERDLKALQKFSERLRRKIAAISDLSAQPDLVVPGAEPYCTYKPLPLAPHSTDQCTRCGACSRACPVHAIPDYDPSKIDKKRCITCMRCVKICPLEARKLPAVTMKMAAQALSSQCSEPRTPEIFL